jgi:hypothetical protein
MPPTEAVDALARPGNIPANLLHPTRSTPDRLILDVSRQFAAFLDDPAGDRAPEGAIICATDSARNREDQERDHRHIIEVPT